MPKAFTSHGHGKTPFVLLDCPLGNYSSFIQFYHEFNKQWGDYFSS